MEQMETAAEAKAARGPKAFIRRELSRIHTPATATGQLSSPQKTPDIQLLCSVRGQRATPQLHTVFTASMQPMQAMRVSALNLMVSVSDSAVCMLLVLVNGIYICLEPSACKLDLLL